MAIELDRDLRGVPDGELECYDLSHRIIRDETLLSYGHSPGHNTRASSVAAGAEPPARPPRSVAAAHRGSSLGAEVAPTQGDRAGSDYPSPKAKGGCTATFRAGRIRRGSYSARGIRLLPRCSWTAKAGPVYPTSKGHWWLVSLFRLLARTSAAASSSSLRCAATVPLIHSSPLTRRRGATSRSRSLTPIASRRMLGLHSRRSRPRRSRRPSTASYCLEASVWCQALCPIMWWLRTVGADSTVFATKPAQSHGREQWPSANRSPKFCTKFKQKRRLLTGLCCRHVVSSLTAVRYRCSIMQSRRSNA